MNVLRLIITSIFFIYFSLNVWGNDYETTYKKAKNIIDICTGSKKNNKIDSDPKLALNLFTKIDDFHQSQAMLCWIHSQGVCGLPKNKVKAIKYCKNTFINSTPDNGNWANSQLKVLMDKSEYIKYSAFVSDTNTLKEEYEFYFVVRKCHEVNPLYISSNELNKAKKKIRATDNFYKSKGLNTDKIFKNAELYPQEHIRKILGALELGGIGGYQQGFASSCKLYFTGMKKVEGPKGKKDF